MTEEKEKWESTTAVLARRAPGLAWIPVSLRKHFTPAALWAAITTLAMAIAYVVNAQADLHKHQESITELQATRKEDRELLETISTQLAVLNSKIEDIDTEVERQREWRERIEDVAETPPHARKHR
jgi:TolA-binding protein